MWRKQTIEKDKEIAKTSKSIHGYTPKQTKRHRVRSVPYSPPLHAKKKLKHLIKDEKLTTTM